MNNFIKSLNCRIVNQYFDIAIEAIYDAAPNPSLWPRALQAIADCFKDVGALLIWQRDDGSAGTIVSPKLVAAQKAFEAGWWRHDIRTLRGWEAEYIEGADAITDRDLVTQEEIDAHPIYTQFLVPHGLGWFGGKSLCPETHIKAYVSVQRAKVKGPFSDEELQFIARLARHVEKALRLSIRLFDAENNNLGLRQALTQLGVGLFAVDSELRIVFSNPIAEALLGDSFAIVNERLWIGSASLRADIATAISHAAKVEFQNPHTQKPILIKQAKSDRPLVIYILPVPRPPTLAHDLLTRARTFILALDSSAEKSLDPTLVRDLLGLTLGEARVAALVGSGLAPKTAAERLGLAETTVRTVLKRVFSKVGVARQGELVALLSRAMLQ
jgi:DNA-binding CsgD family transcriptional regulator/PAS domain-containing protein